MVKKIVPCFVLLIAIVTAGCKAPEMVQVKVDGNKTAGVRMGQTLALKLDSNATTGYLWEITYSENGGVVKEFGKPRYVQTSELIGAGGYQLFRFHPVKKGTAVLKFEYKRSWETGVKPAKTYVVRVVVN